MRRVPGPTLLNGNLAKYVWLGWERLGTGSCGSVAQPRELIVPVHTLNTRTIQFRSESYPCTAPHSTLASLSVAQPRELQYSPRLLVRTLDTRTIQFRSKSPCYTVHSRRSVLSLCLVSLYSCALSTHAPFDFEARAIRIALCSPLKLLANAVQVQLTRNTVACLTVTWRTIAKKNLLPTWQVQHFLTIFEPFLWNQAFPFHHPSPNNLIVILVLEDHL